MRKQDGPLGVEAPREREALAIPPREATVRRHPERAAYDRDTIDPILDEGLVGHAGLVSGGHPYVIPMLYARVDDRLYLHGSPASRLLGAFADGARFCFTVTLVDGIVLARSAFRHSLNYRSVAVLGRARAVRSPDEKLAALRAIVDHVMSRRSDEVRGPSEAELEVTEVVALDLLEASAKVRTGPPLDKPADQGVQTWAGELPLALRAGPPIPDSLCSLPTPSALLAYSRSHG